jgi:hypothetical protein
MLGFSDFFEKRGEALNAPHYALIEEKGLYTCIDSAGGAGRHVPLRSRDTHSATACRPATGACDS